MELFLGTRGQNRWSLSFLVSENLSACRGGSSPPGEGPGYTVLVRAFVPDSVASPEGASALEGLKRENYF